ncbi:MAG TPA: winged helix-turn-helix domain-containing protein, partial [Pyrinomonadaceae bacterium]|nr:winged helix-turn-helix domain-containing protein [Pyrinomonadaceae bacterium]
MPEPDKKFYEFGEFRLDESERLLLRGGEPVHLQARAFDTLLVLVQNNGRLVKKDDLLKSVWADSFVEENNLTQNIYALRKALSDGKNRIETVPRHGYRFTGEVREVFEETEVSLIEERSILRVKLEEKIEEKYWLTGKSIAAVLIFLFAAGGLLVWQFTARKYESKSIIITADIKTLAVLPFQIETPTNADEFLGLAIADDLSRQIKHSESFKFRFVTPGSKVLENQKDAQTLGRLLKADAVFTGVVSKYGETYQIETRLIKTSDGTILWQKMFADGDIYQINNAITADFLKDYPSANTNNTDLKKHRPENVESYKNYIKARALWNKRTSAELHQATILLEQTIAKEPNFALGYAALADAYAFD